MSISERQALIVQDFSDLESWEAKYKKLIDLGRTLKGYPEQYRKDDFQVKGCQSQVWLHASLNSNDRVIFLADSDALISKGLIALLLSVFSEASPKEIFESPITFIQDIGLHSHLTPSRANGLMAMIKQIKLYAFAFISQSQSQVSPTN